MSHSCVRCGSAFADARPLIPPVFCAACLGDIWDRSTERGRRLRWYDDPSVPVAVAPDAHLRATGAPKLFELD